MHLYHDAQAMIVVLRVTFIRPFELNENFYNIIHSDYLQQEDDEQVDLGGYKVNKAVIDMLQLGPAKTATTYARELLRQVFTTEELLGKSITGKQSNAHKEKEARPQLDPVRVNAVVSEYYFFVVLSMESDQ